MMKELLLIKLGGSLITDKGGEKVAKPEVILRLAREIKSALKEDKRDVIIAHGSGSFGHSEAAKYEIKNGLREAKNFRGLPLVAEAAREINNIVVSEFLRLKLKAISFAPASMFLAEDGKLKKAMTENVFSALSKGFLPILYGDIIFDLKRGCCIFSSEMTLSILAKKAKSRYQKIRLIYAGNTNGVYDSEGKTIEKITLKNFEKVSQAITGSDKTDVTGGMLHKVSESLALTKDKMTTVIIDGQRKNELKKAILGGKVNGTVIGV